MDLEPDVVLVNQRRAVDKAGREKCQRQCQLGMSSVKVVCYICSQRVMCHDVAPKPMEKLWNGKIR